MTKILPSIDNYQQGAIIIGFDGQWYKLNSQRKWQLTANSPSRQTIKNRIDKLKNRSITNLIDLLAYFNDPNDGQRYADNAWGSVQYGTAYMLYLSLRILDFYRIDPIKYLNLSINLGQSKNLNSIKNQLMKKEIKQVLNEFCNPIICYGINSTTSRCTNSNLISESDRLKYNINIDQLINQANKEKFDDLNKLIDLPISDIDDIFNYLKNSAWDLWTTIPFVFESLYPMAQIGDIGSSPGFGPILNQMVQSDNYRIGLLAYLLNKGGWISNDSIFCCFDT